MPRRGRGGPRRRRACRVGAGAALDVVGEIRGVAVECVEVVAASIEVGEQCGEVGGGGGSGLGEGLLHGGKAAAGPVHIGMRRGQRLLPDAECSLG